jgi:hypothetical protein
LSLSACSANPTARGVLGFGQRPGQVVEDDDVAGVALVQLQVVVGGGLVLAALEQSLGQGHAGAGIRRVLLDPGGETFFAFFGAAQAVQRAVLADQLGAGGFELVRAFVGCQGGVELLARQGDVALQVGPAADLGFCCWICLASFSASS